MLGAILELLIVLFNFIVKNWIWVLIDLIIFLLIVFIFAPMISDEVPKDPDQGTERDPYCPYGGCM